MKKIIYLLLISLILSFFNSIVYGAFYGFVKTGIKTATTTNSKFTIEPYIDMYMLNSLQRGTSTKAKIGFNKEINEINKFDIYTIDDFYVYVDNYNYTSAKTWYFYLGDRRRADSPITLWGSKLRGVDGGIILNTDKSSLFNSFEINGFWGYSKPKIAGYEATSSESSKNGQFLQGNYGGGASFNIGENIKIEGLYSLFQDDENSLKTNEDYQTTPVKNQIISGKFGFYDNYNRFYINYAQSKYNPDIRDTSSDDVSGNALYIEGDGYINNNTHYNINLMYIDDKYMSVAVSSFENDIIKFYTGLDWRGKKVSLSGDGYYKVNNVANNDNVLTTPEYGISSGASFNFTETFLLSIKLTYKNAKSKKEVNNSFDKWNMYEVGGEISKRFYFGSVFKALKFSIISKYSKKNDDSKINGSTAVNQEFINLGVISSLDLYKLGNTLQIMYYNLKSSLAENIISGLEKFTYHIIRNKWINFIEYNGIFDYQNNSVIYTKNTIWYGNEMYLNYKNSLKLNVGYEIFDSKSENYNSYKSFKTKLEYQYTF